MVVTVENQQSYQVYILYDSALRPAGISAHTRNETPIMNNILVDVHTHYHRCLVPVVELTGRHYVITNTGQ